jgi:hypothetical protein
MEPVKRKLKTDCNKKLIFAIKCPCPHVGEIERTKQEKENHDQEKLKGNDKRAPYLQSKLFCSR